MSRGGAPSAAGPGLARRRLCLALAGLPLAACETTSLPPGPPPAPLGLRAVVVPTPAAPMNPQVEGTFTGEGEVARIAVELVLGPPRRALALAFVSDGASAAERLRGHLVEALRAGGVAVRELAVRRPDPAPLREPPPDAGAPVVDAALLAFGYGLFANVYRPRGLLRLRVTAADGSLLLDETIGVGHGGSSRWRAVAGPEDPAFRTPWALRDGAAQAVAGVDAAIAAAAREAARRVGP